MAPFAPSLFVFFFHLINNWPKLAVYIFNHSTISSSLVELVEIRWTRPTRLRHNGNNGLFANTPSDFRKNYGLVHLSVCSSLLRTWPNRTIQSLEWKISRDYGQKQFGWITDECQTLWVAPEQSNYNVEVWVKLVNEKILHGETYIQIRDRWIAAIGDSFSSGEGNPDIPANLVENAMAKWLSDRCHRSSRSWAYKVYKKVKSTISRQTAVHFTYLSCTGASVDNGILVAYNGTSQINILEQISQIRGSGPDLLMMSVGGNDIGYSEILSTLILGSTTLLFSTIDMRFFYTSHQLDRVGNTIQKLKPDQVIVPHYFDLTRNERGLIDANCTDMRQISTENLVLAEKKILRRINDLISKKSHQYGWLAVDGIAELFRSRGCCSSKSLIRSIRDSIRLQGNSFGAFHPTEEAHQQIADLIIKRMIQFDD
ncbi:unnamed protein product [Thelazia callipaeda]|uniref:SGNH_hydro domain-containing protein n=1 Tax=Thelazia callipaeda TaxID=103827 RepID=A0A0N5CQY0_THECL|nr:unnamed protein product [Thelazia callipaeda]